jgi:hypothetical protein
MEKVMLFRYLLTAITFLSFIAPAFCMQQNKEVDSRADLSGYKKIVADKINKLDLGTLKKEIVPTSIPSTTAPMPVPHGADTQTQNAEENAQIEAAQNGVVNNAPLWNRFELIVAAGICAYFMMLYNSREDIKNLCSYISSFWQK